MLKQCDLPIFHRLPLHRMILLMILLFNCIDEHTKTTCKLRVEAPLVIRHTGSDQSTEKARACVSARLDEGVQQRFCRTAKKNDQIIANRLNIALLHSSFSNSDGSGSDDGNGILIIIVIIEIM